MTVLPFGSLRLDFFNPNSSNVWSNGSNITEASSLMPLIIPYKGLTKSGAGQNITYMLLIRGVLVTIDSKCASRNIRNT